MPPRKKLTNEENFRGDLLEEREKLEVNKVLEEASNEEDLTPSHWKVHSSGKVEKMEEHIIDPSAWGLGDIPEPEVLDDGDEVKVTIVSVVNAETQEAKIPYYRVILEVPDRPLVKSFSHNVYRPHEGQTAKQAYDTKYNFQQFMRAFNMDMTRSFNPFTDWLGETAWCIVNMKESKDYGKQNQVRKWILPK